MKYCIFVCFSSPVCTLIHWKLELCLQSGLRDFKEDGTYIIAKCKNCGTMCTIDNYGFSGCIPGMPVYCDSMKLCSSCMPTDIFKAMTSDM